MARLTATIRPRINITIKKYFDKPGINWMILFIWLVTAYDIRCCEYLTVGEELNPMADWIIRSYGLWTFVGLKVFGTAVATEWLRRLYPFYTYSIVAMYAVLLLILWSF